MILFAPFETVACDLNLGFLSLDNNNQRITHKILPNNGVCYMNFSNFKVHVHCISIIKHVNKHCSAV